MTDTPLMNDDAARSPTGEILDQVKTPPTETKTGTEADSSTTKTTETKTEPTTTETKDGNTTLTKPADKDTKAADAKTDAPKVPEKYADFKAPDGYTLDSKTIEAATPIFKELGLTQDAAQKLIDFHATKMIEVNKAAQSTYETTRADWQAKTLADPDIKAYSTDGKTGIEAVKVDIGRALATLDPGLAKDFKAAMDLTGAGDNPAFVKAFWKLSQSVIEGKHVSGAGPSPLGQRAPGQGEKPTPAKAMYPNNP